MKNSNYIRNTNNYVLKVKGGEGGGGGAGSADPRNFSAKSADPEFLKVKSESAKGLAENDKIRAFQYDYSHKGI